MIKVWNAKPQPKEYFPFGIVATKEVDGKFVNSNPMPFNTMNDNIMGFIFDGDAVAMQIDIANAADCIFQDVMANGSAVLVMVNTKIVADILVLEPPFDVYLAWHSF